MGDWLEKIVYKFINLILILNKLIKESWHTSSKTTQPVESSIATDPFYCDEYEIDNRECIDEKDLKQFVFNLLIKYFNSHKSKRGAYKMFDKDRLYSLIDDMSSYG